jgi:hypothetical protein
VFSGSDGMPHQGHDHIYLAISGKGVFNMVHNAHDKFPIGFWNIIPATQLGTEAVKDWVDFGTTLTMTGQYYAGQDKVKMRAILDECHAQGIRLIFQDARLTYHCLYNGHYEEDMKEVLRDFGDHPAVYGIHLGDEPMAGQTEDAIEAVRVMKRLCPDKKAYLNLLPWYSDQFGGVEARVAISGDYKQYLIDFIRQSGADILSYDCYFQLEELHGRLTDRALETYFKNLRIFHEAAVETGVELWYTTLAVGHMMYRCPTQDDIRWQINTAVALGVKSLFYWFLYSGFYNANYRVAPINELFERTETFNWISTENRLFQHVFGKLFCELELEKAYFHGETYGGYPQLLEGDEYIRAVRPVQQTPMIVSRFKRVSDPSRVYYALVCNSQRDPASVFFEMEPGVEVEEVRSTDGIITHTPRPFEDTNRIHYWFGPGQMWVIAVKATKED